VGNAGDLGAEGDEPVQAHGLRSTRCSARVGGQPRRRRVRRQQPAQSRPPSETWIADVTLMTGTVKAYLSTRLDGEPQFVLSADIAGKPEICNGSSRSSVLGKLRKSLARVT
jgi:hypothetical protein